MNQFPTREELETRSRKAEERLREIQDAYNTFVEKAAELEQEEAELMKQLASNIDQAKMYSILSKIDSLK